jgi:adhesin/invasin
LSSTQVDLDALSATEQLTAQVLDQNGQPMPEELITWSSSNAQVATVSATGLVTAVDNGPAEVTASSGSLSASAAVDVAQVVATLEKAAGDTQSGTVGQALPEAVVVRALDRLNNPVVGTSVSFAVASGGGSVSPASGTTNARGRASTTWALGTSAAVAQQLDATHADGAPAASFSATANAAAPGSAEKIQGDAQTGPAALALPDSIVVRVVDAFGNPVAGQTVGFAVTAGGGSVSPGSADSDADGRAATQWTVGPGLGANTLQATVGGLPPTTFNATSVTGPPANLIKETGDNQFAMVNAAVAMPPAVKVTDAGGNPVADVDVNYAVASGGGSITGELAMTDAAGLAAVGSWTLGPDPGTNELTAAVDGLATVTFTATGVPEAVAANIEKEAGDNQSATVNTAVAIPPTVKLTDASMNPVAGVLVTFEVASGGGSITGATVASDIDGLAAVGSWTLGTAAGPNTLTATTLGLAPVTFTATGTARLRHQHPAVGPGDRRVRQSRSKRDRDVHRD